MSESLSEAVPAAIRGFIDATNAGDSAAFVAGFTEDAFLSDWGREFVGHDGVAEWDRSDNIGKRSHFDLLAVKPGVGDQQFVATVVVSGEGFTGTSDLEFTVRGDRVARLVIAP
ncbi:nuclear transport factor 2 family protein [uncultured Amnibacterium sp.]|uniref:nuclear transport factor 2 family protein n=1 Tax=uncultured Amnibacterium sp. TaxID=1631851 RepID=UPI0035CBBFA9